MSYPTVVRKKIRLCARFGHLPESTNPRGTHPLRSWTPHGVVLCYWCARCGDLVPRRREVTHG